MIVIINYGMGNLGAIENMLRKIGAPTVISSNKIDIEKADKLILPGIGAFDNGIRNLDNLGLPPLLHKKVIQEKTPILGICLGMQLMTINSEEGSLPGLGWFEAKTARFRFGETQNHLKIPHMGWNTIRIVKGGGLYKDLHAETRFYFAHSYHVVCNKREDIVTTTTYGYEFASSIQKENIFGVQFHPEKSHRFGMELLKNFVFN